MLLLQRLDDVIALTRLDEHGQPEGDAERFAAAELAEVVARYEREHPRWVWADTRRWYPALLAAGVRVERCLDLRLCHAILRLSEYVRGFEQSPDTESAQAGFGPWDRSLVFPETVPERQPINHGETLFELEREPKPAAVDPARRQEDDAGAELRRQLRAVAGSAQAGSLRLLLMAESVGALIAEEMPFAGVPWNAAVHDRLLTEILGPRPAFGQRPAALHRLLVEIRAALDDPHANPDSPAELLKSLNNAGIFVKSTSKWLLREVKHPVIAPLMEYKKRARLLTANGWNWLDHWVVDGRFRPEYVVGGVVTGRWATSGGGALQLPREIRGAVRADLGWKLVVADAAQLEPRILAGMSNDIGMMQAGNAGDLYQGIVDAGAVASREQAKIAMLGAMYGATTGESGRLMPQLSRSFPRAIALTERAAQAGERAEQVTTRLGRSSPLPDAEHRLVQEAAYDENAGEREQSRARSRSRAWGRFTRNFVVQGTAAEWAMCWLASLRRRLFALAETARAEGVIFAGDWPATTPHLVFFVHDEVIVHSPVVLAERVTEEIRAAAAEAGRLLFGDAPLSFPISVAVVDNYAQAK